MTDMTAQSHRAGLKQTGGQNRGLPSQELIAKDPLISMCLMTAST